MAARWERSPVSLNMFMFLQDAGNSIFSKAKKQFQSVQICLANLRYKPFNNQTSGSVRLKFLFLDVKMASNARRGPFTWPTIVAAPNASRENVDAHRDQKATHPSVEGEAGHVCDNGFITKKWITHNY